MSVIFITGSLTVLAMARGGSRPTPSGLPCSQKGTSGLSEKWGYCFGCGTLKLDMSYSLLSFLRWSMSLVCVMASPCGRRNSKYWKSCSDFLTLCGTDTCSPRFRESSQSFLVSDLRVSSSCPRVPKYGSSTRSRPTSLNSRSGLTGAFTGRSPARARLAWWSASARSRMWAMGHCRGSVFALGGWGSKTGAHSAAYFSPKALPAPLSSARRLSASAVWVATSGTRSALWWGGYMPLTTVVMFWSSTIWPRRCWTRWLALTRTWWSMKPFDNASLACIRSLSVSRPSQSLSKARPMK
mmetsp:Transcript_55879/g.149594  ORF Transcript_55879/g.149594 Transcript_55879/m.149594 type:complete len:297 (+) Transcript_55879:813-1703(+)